MTIYIGFSDATKALGLDPQFDQLNNGLIRIYSGVRPATADTSIGAQVLLATAAFGNPAFAATAAGVKTANAITPGIAVAAGVPSFVRLVKSDSITVVGDADIGAIGSGNAFETASASISIGATVVISALPITG